MFCDSVLWTGSTWNQVPRVIAEIQVFASAALRVASEMSKSKVGKNSLTFARRLVLKILSAMRLMLPVSRAQGQRIVNKYSV